MTRLPASRYRVCVEKIRRHNPTDVPDRPDLDDALLVLVRLLARWAAQEVVGNADAAPGIENDGASDEPHRGS